MKKNDFVILCENGVILNFKTIPSAKKNELVLSDGNQLKIKIAATAVKGRANKELIKYLSLLLNIKKSDFEITKGEKSEYKTLFIRTNKQLQVVSSITKLK